MHRTILFALTNKASLFQTKRDHNGPLWHLSIYLPSAIDITNFPEKKKKLVRKVKLSIWQDAKLSQKRLIECST